MKKILAIAVALFAFVAVASAQPRALGLRAGYGGELSYQHTLGGANFAELDLGLWQHGFKLTGAYDFILAGDGNFNLYAGPAAAVGTWKVNDNSDFVAGVGGQIGVEYNFPIPLQLSLDWEPIYYFGDDHGFYAYGIALGVRYRF